MWKPIFELARTTSLVLTITADEKAGLLKVTVNPKPASKDAPAALSQPLTLTATPDELDAGFVEAVSAYGGSYQSLKETVEASVAVMEAARKEAASKAAAKTAARAAPKQAASTVNGAAPVAPKSADQDAGEDADDGADASAGDGETAAPSAAPVVERDTATINLFA